MQLPKSKLACTLAFLAILSGCETTVEVNDMCIFAPSELIEPTYDPEAERLFQLGRAHDVTIRTEARDTIPETLLEASVPDRSIARQYYQQAADMGHTDAMNNLAVYLHNGWGHGLGNYPKDFQGAYRLNIEMARRGDPKGYVGMASYLFSDRIGPPREETAVACLVEGAKIDHVPAIQQLALNDLGSVGNTYVDGRPPERIARGIALLEELFRRGFADAHRDLGNYYSLHLRDLDKYEFYMRSATAAGAVRAYLSLDGTYRTREFGRNTVLEAACVADLTVETQRDIETLCPRAGGPLTREQVGLPPAPSPLDIPQYLTDYQARYPQQ